MRGAWFPSIVAGFVGGIAAGSFFDFGPGFPALFFLLGGIVFLLSLFQQSWRTQYNTFVPALVLFLCMAGVGTWHIHGVDVKSGDLTLERRVGETILVEGVVSAEPDERERSTRLVVALDTLREGETATTLNTKALVTTEPYPAIAYGDRLRVRGILLVPENFETGNGRTFEYRAYLGKDNIFYELAFPEITVVSQGEGATLVRVLFSAKQKFLGSIRRFIPEPHAALLSGLLVGAKQSLGRELQDNFRTVGLVHIVVLSGYNITIVADGTLRFFRVFLSRGVSTTLGAFSIILFAVMVGGGATVVRASIMALLVLVAQSTGRTYEATRALFIAGFLMLVHNPKILIFDPSFQLSFMATLGLVVVSPRILPFVTVIPKRFAIRETVVTTIATQLFVLPLLLYLTGNLSLVALPANLLVLLSVPPAMLFGFLTGIFGFIHPFLALPFASVAYGLLSYKLAIVDFFAHVPFASVTVPAFPFTVLTMLYRLYGFILIFLKRVRVAG